MRPSSIDLREGPFSTGRPHRADRERRRMRRSRLAALILASTVLGAVVGALAAPSADASAAPVNPAATSISPVSSAPPTASTPQATSTSPTASAQPVASASPAVSPPPREAPDEAPVGGAPDEGSTPAPISVTIAPLPSPVRLPQTIGGTRTPGTQVQVQGVDGPGQPLCIAPAADSTDWSCVISALPSGPAVPVKVVALAGGATTEQNTTLAWLNAPTLVADEKPTTAGQVGGRGYPGAVVAATVASRGNTCTATVDGSGAWTCVLAEPLPSGTHRVTAAQSTDFSSGASAATTVDVQIDKDAPPTPTLVSPTAGSRLPLGDATISGRGEDGNSVIVFAGARPLCQAEVRGGVWRCRAVSIPAGEYAVNAMQLDAAGNASAATASVKVEFTDQAPAPSPTPGGSASAPSDGPPRPDDGPDLRGRDPGAPADDAPRGADAAHPNPDPAPGGGFITRGWEQLQAPTNLGTSLAPLASVNAPQLALAAGLAAATVILIILPALLVGRVLRGRCARLPSVTGRNRTRGAPVTPAAPVVDRWSRALFGTAAAAGLLTLSMPVLVEGNQVRLAVAAAVAVAVLNLLGNVGVVRAARGLFGVDVVTVTRLPLLAATAATALASRLLGLAPPLVAGQILGTRFASTASPRQRSAVSLAQIAVTASSVIVGWLVYSVVPADGATLQLVVRETAGVLTLTAAGSAALATLPVAALPGVHILRRSPHLWAAVTALTWSLLFLVLTAVAPGRSAPAVGSMLAVAVGFAAVSAAVWLWTRYVEPSLRTD